MRVSSLPCGVTPSSESRKQAIARLNSLVPCGPRSIGGSATQLARQKFRGLHVGKGPANLCPLSKKINLCPMVTLCSTELLKSWRAEQTQRDFYSSHRSVLLFVFLKESRDQQPLVCSAIWTAMRFSKIKMLPGLFSCNHHTSMSSFPDVTCRRPIFRTELPTIRNLSCITIL